MSSAKQQGAIERDWKPSAEFRYFIHDPDGEGFIYFRSAEDRDAASHDIIMQYLDDGWDESVENVVAGEVTHTCDKVNVTPRPPEDEIDGEGHDKDGDYWAEEWAYKCGYELVAVAGSPSKAATDVLAERRRQVEAEGWTPEHDDEHGEGELPAAAASYAIDACGIALGHASKDHPPSVWPWDRQWWKPQGARRNLVKAGALILAEIERLDRATAKEEAGGV